MQGIMILILRAVAVVMIANGVWMLFAAFNWFVWIPAGLPDTGPPNGHLIRDVGLAYIINGMALMWSSVNLAQRRVAFVMCAAFSVGHAALHVVEISLGVLPRSHWLLDFPPVILPAVMLLVLALPAGWRWLTATPR